MKKTEIISLILSTTILTSCGLVTQNTVTDDLPARSTTDIGYQRPTVTKAPADKIASATVRTPEEELTNLAKFDGAGAIFQIATIQSSQDESEEGAGNPIFPSQSGLGYDSAATRITAINEKYNIQITNYPITLEKLLEDLETNSTINGYTADLILLPTELISAFDDTDHLIDPERVPFYDDTAGYLDGDFAEVFSDYAIYGDALVCPEDNLCIYYNTRLADELGIGSLYSTVISNHWTWSTFAKHCKLGKISSEIDLSYPIALTTGLSYSEVLDRDKNLRELPQEDRDRIDAILNPIADSILSEDAIDHFMAGESLFYLGNLLDSEKLAKMTDQWSILPIPTTTEGGSYTTLHDYRAADTVFLIPRYAFGSERSIQIIAALCSVCDQTKDELRRSLYDFFRVNEARILLEYILNY